MIYVVNIDQNGGVTFNYQPLYDEFNALGGWARYLQRTWFVATTYPIEEVVRRLKTHLSPSDLLLVNRLVLPYRAWLPVDAWTWLDTMYPIWGNL